MSQPSINSEASGNSLGVTSTAATELETPSSPSKPAPSYVKLAMRNMVRKGGKSLYHFALTMLGLLAVLVGLAYLTH